MFEDYFFKYYYYRVLIFNIIIMVRTITKFDSFLHRLIVFYSGLARERPPLESLYIFNESILKRCRSEVGGARRFVTSKKYTSVCNFLNVFYLQHAK